MSEWIDTPLTLGALNLALTHRQPAPELVFHSDRGVQCAAHGHRAAWAAAKPHPAGGQQPPLPAEL